MFMSQFPQTLLVQLAPNSPPPTEAPSSQPDAGNAFPMWILVLPLAALVLWALIKSRANRR